MRLKRTNQDRESHTPPTETASQASLENSKGRETKEPEKNNVAKPISM